MIKLEDVNLYKFPTRIALIVKGILSGCFDPNLLDHVFYIDVDHYDFLEEIFSCKEFGLWTPDSWDTMKTAIEIWLKDHPEYLNKKEEKKYFAVFLSGVKYNPLDSVEKAREFLVKMGFKEEDEAYIVEVKPLEKLEYIGDFINFVKVDKFD